MYNTNYFLGSCRRHPKFPDVKRVTFILLSSSADASISNVMPLSGLQSGLSQSDMFFTILRRDDQYRHVLHVFIIVFWAFALVFG